MALRKLAAFGIIIVGVGLVSLTAPFLMHELSLVPGNHAYSNLRRNGVWTEAELEIIESTRLTALKHQETAKARSELGSVYLYRAQTTVDPELRIMYAKIATKYLEQALAQKPLLPFSWLKVASANLLLGPDERMAAVSAWRKSVRTAPFEPFMILQQIQVGLILLDDLTSNDIVSLTDLLAKAHRWDERRYSAFVESNNLGELIEKVMLANNLALVP